MKRVGVAEFKARLSHYLRAVRNGHDLTILDRGQPIATVSAVSKSSALVVREPVGEYKAPRDVPLPPPLPLDTDPVELLLEDRQQR